MRKTFAYLLLILVAAYAEISAQVYSGTAVADLTPPAGTPSAGYIRRENIMEGVQDPLLATSLVLKNENSCVVFCAVDNLGFPTEMVQAIIQKVRQTAPSLIDAEIYIGSSHTHAGGGAFLNVPFIGAWLAGTYDPEVTQFYIEQTVQSIVKAAKNLRPAKVGLGYGEAYLSQFFSQWPEKGSPVPDVSVIKVTDLNDVPLAVVFNYAMHPTTLDHTNRLFSADFVAPARATLKTLLGKDVVPLYFNGAQAEIFPLLNPEQTREVQKEAIGKKLGTIVANIWNQTETQENLGISYEKFRYEFTVQPNPHGFHLPLPSYFTEINLLVLNGNHAFAMIPGELSTVYHKRFIERSQQWGYAHFSILGLVNDAHGYIVLPEAWRKCTKESELSFGGEFYGELIEKKISELLIKFAPAELPQETEENPPVVEEPSNPEEAIEEEIHEEPVVGVNSDPEEENLEVEAVNN